MPNGTINRVLLHYKQLGLWYGGGKSRSYRGWTRDRFNRLCHMFNITQDEAAALVCIPASMLKRYLKANNIPPWVSLHFEFMEAAYVQATSGHVRIIMPCHHIYPDHPATTLHD